MAETTVPEATEQSERTDLMLSAVYELDALARIAPGLVPVTDDQVHYLIRGICGRMLRLTSLLMSGLDDDDEFDGLKTVIDFGTSQA